MKKLIFVVLSLCCIFFSCNVFCLEEGIKILKNSDPNNPIFKPMELTRYEYLYIIFDRVRLNFIEDNAIRVNPLIKNIEFAVNEKEKYIRVDIVVPDDISKTDLLIAYRLANHYGECVKAGAVWLDDYKIKIVDVQLSKQLRSLEDLNK